LNNSSHTIALHYNCICAADAWKCTSELDMHKEEGRYQRSVALYCNGNQDSNVRHFLSSELTRSFLVMKHNHCFTSSISHHLNSAPFLYLHHHHCQWQTIVFIRFLYLSPQDLSTQS